MALSTARIHRVRGRPPLLAAGITSVIHSHSSSVRSLGYIFSFIYLFYATCEDFSDRLLGEYLRRHCFFAPLRESVQIRQKTVRYRPIDKLLDALSGILCGAKTMAQNNVTIRTERAVQRAFGRTGCAEQSTIARTLRACTAENVVQLHKVSWYYLKRYGATPRHRFHDTRLWVDIDLTPMPIGAKAEGSERTWMG